MQVVSIGQQYGKHVWLHAISTVWIVKKTTLKNENNHTEKK